MSFISLHTHSSWSLLDGAMTPKQIVERVKELGQDTVALTDHGNMHGVIKFWDACKEGNIKPIIGSEFYMSPFERTRKEKIEGMPPAFHLTLLAKNKTGLTNLYKLSSLAFTEGHYYKPRVDHELLRKYHDGLICLSGCFSGKIQWYLRNYIESRDNDEPTEDKQWLELAEEEAKVFQGIFGSDFFMEFQRIIPIQEEIVPLQIDICKKLSISGVATCDSHYARPSDVDFHEQVVCLSIGKTIKDEKRMGRMEGLYLKSEEEMRELWKDHPAVIDNTQVIADRCTLDKEDLYGKVDYIFPIFGDDKASDIEEFEKQCWIGLKEREANEDIDKGREEEYIERLKYEIRVIKEMGFPSYFLIVSDYVRWAKENGIIVGTARGSCAGSLTAYCLGITEIDPIECELFFERFLNLGRKGSCPDIDCDFEMDRRAEVISYIVDKYGRDKVAQITTFSKFKPRGACRDFARVQGEPYFLGEKASKLIPPAVAGKEPTWEIALKASPELQSGEFGNIIRMAQKSEDINKGRGVHAGGVVISQGDIEEIVPRCLSVGKNKEVVSQWDMEDLERVGLVKLDILGLTALTIIGKTLQLIKSITGDVIDINKIAHNDPEAYRLISKGHTSGLFQLDGGGGIRDLCIQLKPQSISEIAIISALYRPGPIDSGATREYVERKNNRSPVEYLVPELEPILKETLGVLTYQEQIMRIATDLAGYTLVEADTLRKAVGKKKHKLMKEQEKKFVTGITDNNIDKESAQEIWDNIKEHAKYSFNRCLTLDTLISAEDNILSIGEIKEKLQQEQTVILRSYNTDTEEVFMDECLEVIDCSEQEAYEIKLSNNAVIQCTLDHEFLTEEGKLPLRIILQKELDIISAV